ncbi:Hsp70 family protein [Staphylococcus aureus]
MDQLGIPGRTNKLVKKEIGKEPNKGVNPDEVVAMVAAIQVALSQVTLKMYHSRLTPLSLGIEILGGRNQYGFSHHLASTKSIQQQKIIRLSADYTYSTR